ncbi:inorganic diphosphatase [Candidatus Saccharibacteria bacterium]|nr:inorganic diphosphatase [Candidatus Saccharibacteria bacterium]MBR0424381.1 inorganic diphosphatase [Candidatus Saccharibacteria bacterium]
MADFNKVLDPGDYENGELNVVIEIPTGSNHKIEWDRERACFMLDRVEPIAFAKPCNYGFIPQTIDEDGDELDVLMITDQPLTTGIWMKAKILGVMKFVDDGEVDDKIICVPEDDRNNGDCYKTLEDLPKRTLEQIEFHFNHYKDLKKPGTTKVQKFGDIKEAKQVIKDSIARYEEAHPEVAMKKGAEKFVSDIKAKLEEM